MIATWKGYRTARRPETSAVPHSGTETRPLTTRDGAVSVLAGLPERFLGFLSFSFAELATFCSQIRGGIRSTPAVNRLPCDTHESHPSTNNPGVPFYKSATGESMLDARRSRTPSPLPSACACVQADDHSCGRTASRHTPAAHASSSPAHLPACLLDSTAAIVLLCGVHLLGACRSSRSKRERENLGAADDVDTSAHRFRRKNTRKRLRHGRSMDGWMRTADGWMDGPKAGRPQGGG